VYRTVLTSACAEVEVKRSRFLAQVKRVESEADARAFIDSIRKAHHDARHHCTAFVIGPDQMLQRSNDDGEPSGTAGAPMLEVLTRREISDVVAVVTRWFGGTLLGAGGLVRAYGDAVSAALDVAGVQERALRHTMEVTALVSDAGVLDNRLRQLGTVTGVDYGSRAVFTVSVEDPAAFEVHLAEISAGRATCTYVAQQYVDL
jgi:uncharacterized YigZ family protein